MQSSEGGTAKPPQAEDAVDRCLAEVRERADFSDACCVMGAASVYRRALARCVSSLGAEAKVINPIVTGWRKKNIRKAKTDSEDASSIASVYFAGLCLAQWHMEDPSQDLRSLTRDIDREDEALTKLKVMLRQETRRSFPEYESEFKNARFFSPPALALFERCPTARDVLGHQGRFIAGVIASGSARGKGAYMRKAGRLKSLAKSSLTWIGPGSMEASIIKRLCRQIGEQSEGVALLKSLLEAEAEAQSPALLGMYRGFGFTGYLSARFAVDLGGISRFDNEKRLVAWCGLDPSIRQSGSSVSAKGGISKRGSRTVRKVFYLASLDYISHPGKSKDFADLEAYYRKKRRDGKHHCVAAVACSTKLLRRFCYRYKDLLKETSK